MLNADVTILADSVRGARSSEELVSTVPRVFVMADTVRDLNVNIIHMVIKQVEGIDEPVKLVSPMGFAVGANSNKIFAWGVSYEQPANMIDSDEEEKN